MEALPLREAFGELVKKRLWYKNCPISARQAQKDKYMFAKGNNIPECRMRIYLASSGAECVQNEMWVLK